MSGFVEPLHPVPHRCSPGWFTDHRGQLQQRHGSEGNVWRCDCGQLFLSVPPPIVHRGMQMCVNQWRPLTRRERRRWIKRAADSELEAGK